jgi:phosphatidylglycerophosphatase A
MSQPNPNTPSTTTSSAARKPRVALAIATAFGLGYLPTAPGTFGSLGGIALAMFPFWFIAVLSWAWGAVGMENPSLGSLTFDSFVFIQCLLAIAVASIGVWTAHRAARYWSAKDPQRVVIDEVSGQQLTLLLGGFWPLHASTTSIESYSQAILWTTHPLGTSMAILPDWKYLLLGFILFRVFDIWKPFPARQAESLPGGLGIMADDWIAGIYAALGLWIARALGL